MLVAHAVQNEELFCPLVQGFVCLVKGIRGLKMWDAGRWVQGSLINNLLYSGLFPIPHLPLPHLLSPLRVGLLCSNLLFDNFYDSEGLPKDLVNLPQNNMKPHTDPLGKQCL